LTWEKLFTPAAPPKHALLPDFEEKLFRHAGPGDNAEPRGVTATGGLR
jgi:hypothetical protein